MEVVRWIEIIFMAVLMISSLGQLVSPENEEPGWNFVIFICSLTSLVYGILSK